MNIAIKLRDCLASMIEVLLRPVLFSTIEKINRLNQENLSIAFLHRDTFLQFRNCHANQDVVVMACGPSLNDYVPIRDAVTIGVNSSFMKDNANLNYLFIEDLHNRNREFIEKAASYRSGECKKFFGLSGLFCQDADWIPPASDCFRANAFRFKTDNLIGFGFEKEKYEFRFDISTQPLADFGSVVFPAIQFALWTNPKRIFLVGCDCTNIGHFDSKTTNPKYNTSVLLDGYLKLKSFAKTYYPQTEIISVNPVGLKGLFQDWYQAKGPLE